MDRKGKLLNWLADEANLSGEPFPGQFIVEILGQDRVLIENHKGICEYGNNRINISCEFGSVTVIGSGLELFRMSREQLIIRGRIDCITLHRR